MLWVYPCHQRVIMVIHNSAGKARHNSRLNHCTAFVPSSDWTLKIWKDFKLNYFYDVQMRSLFSHKLWVLRNYFAFFFFSKKLPLLSFWRVFLAFLKIYVLQSAVHIFPLLKLSCKNKRWRLLVNFQCDVATWSSFNGHASNIVAIIFYFLYGKAVTALITSRWTTFHQIKIQH